MKYGGDRLCPLTSGKHVSNEAWMAVKDIPNFIIGVSEVLVSWELLKDRNNLHGFYVSWTFLGIIFSM